MNFAPYQDESPEIERALSPPVADAHRAKSPNYRSPRASPPVAGFADASGLPSPSQFAGASGPSSRGGHGHGHGNENENGRTSYFSGDVESGRGGRSGLGAFETSLPIRMDFEAMLAYILLPPAGGVLLLLFEHKSDYVRYVGEKWTQPKCHCWGHVPFEATII